MSSTITRAGKPVEEVTESAPELVEKPVEEVTESAPELVEKPGIPIPKDFKNAMYQTLNQKFKIDVSYESDRPFFQFSILVPKEYSNARDGHWDLYHEDRRIKVIENAQGAGGVKEWVQKVYDNFPMETKAKITADRV